MQKHFAVIPLKIISCKIFFKLLNINVRTANKNKNNVFNRSSDSDKI